MTHSVNTALKMVEEERRQNMLLAEEIVRLQKETDLRRDLHERLIMENQRLNELLHHAKEASKREAEYRKQLQADRDSWQRRHEMLVNALAGPAHEKEKGE